MIYARPSRKSWRLAKYYEFIYLVLALKLAMKWLFAGICSLWCIWFYGFSWQETLVWVDVLLPYDRGEFVNVVHRLGVVDSMVMIWTYFLLHFFFQLSKLKSILILLYMLCRSIWKMASLWKPMFHCAFRDNCMTCVKLFKMFVWLPGKCQEASSCMF